MQRFHRITTIALLVGAAGIAAGAALAQDQPTPPAAHPGRDMGPGRHDPMDMRGMFERLQLTGEQSKKIEDIQYTHRKRVIAKRAELETAHLDLARLMHADEPDARAINAQIDKLAQLRAGLEKEHIAGMLEIRGVLTPEQRKEWHGMHGGGMHGWGPGMRGMHGMHRMHGMIGPGGMGDGMHGDLIPDGPEDSEDPEDGSDWM